MKQVTLAIDAMGGDRGPSSTVPATLSALRRHPHLHVVLVGDEAQIRQKLGRKAKLYESRLRIEHTDQEVFMSDSVAVALRQKRRSSMRVALSLLKKGEVQACVSAGNTGALMAVARAVLKMLPGVSRPAIVAAFPTMNKQLCYMLDLGANVDCDPEYLCQFAVMGSILAESVHGVPSPRVALLNIGQESTKGNESVKLAAQELTSSGINYVGYVEGDSIFRGDADVVVCDGFVGNVSLKTTEGVGKLVRQLLKDAFRRTWFTRILSVLALPVLKGLAKDLDPRRYNGASLLGLNGIVVKSHGGADRFAFYHAICEALNEVEQDVPARIQRQVTQYFGGVPS